MDSASLVASQMDFIYTQIGGQNGLINFPNSYPLHANSAGNIFEIYNLNQDDIANLELYASSDYNANQINFKLTGISMSLRNPDNGIYSTFDFVVPGLLKEVQDMVNKNLALARLTTTGTRVVFFPFAGINDGNVTVASMTDKLTNAVLFVPTTSSTEGYVKTYDVTFSMN